MNKQELEAKLDKIFPDKRAEYGENKYFYKNMRFSVRGDGFVTTRLITWRLNQSSASSAFYVGGTGFSLGRLYIL